MKRGAPSSSPSLLPSLTPPPAIPEDVLFASNPHLDTQFGPKACLSGGAVLDTAEWDQLADFLSRKKSAGKTGEGLPARCRVSRSSTRPTNPLSLSLYSLECSAELLRKAIFAGFFPCATEVQLPNDACLADRGLLLLEIAGAGRLRKGLDPGGRVVMEGVKGLKVGKKTLKCLKKAQYSLKVNTQFQGAWQQIVAEKGVDWMGFSAIRAAYSQLYREQTGQAGQVMAQTGGGGITMVSFELCDAARGGQGKLVACEIGYICGAAYTCLSLFASRAAEHARCGRIRTECVLLWLAEAGVDLFDAGCTADYYCELFGFRKTTRLEFLRLWRAARVRPAPQLGEVVLSMERGLSHSRMQAMLLRQASKLNPLQPVLVPHSSSSTQQREEAKDAKEATTATAGKAGKRWALECELALPDSCAVGALQAALTPILGSISNVVLVPSKASKGKQAERVGSSSSSRAIVFLEQEMCVARALEMGSASVVVDGATRKVSFRSAATKAKKAKKQRARTNSEATAT